MGGANSVRAVSIHHCAGERTIFIAAYNSKIRASRRCAPKRSHAGLTLPWRSGRRRGAVMQYPGGHGGGHGDCRGAVTLRPGAVPELRQLADITVHDGRYASLHHISIPSHSRPHAAVAPSRRPWPKRIPRRLAWLYNEPSSMVLTVFRGLVMQSCFGCAVARPRCAGTRRRRRHRTPPSRSRAAYWYMTAHLLAQAAL